MSISPIKRNKILSFLISVFIIFAFAFAAYILNGNTLSGAHGQNLGSAENQDLSIVVISDKVYPVIAPSQNQRVSLTIDLTNKSTAVLQISPGLQMYLQDSSGTVNNMTAQFLPPFAPIGGPLNPGQSWQQTIDFQITNGTFPSKFIFHKDGSSDPLGIGL